MKQEKSSMDGVEYLTLKIKPPNRAKRLWLERTAQSYRQAMQLALDIAKAQQISSQADLYFAVLRCELDLPEDYVYMAVKDAFSLVQSYYELRKAKRKTSFPKLKRSQGIGLEVNSYALKKDGDRWVLRVSTGRRGHHIWLPLYVPSKYVDRLQLVWGDAKLLERDGNWYVALPIRVTSTPVVYSGQPTFIGIDLGVVRYAVVATPDRAVFFNGKPISRKRKHFEDLRRRYQRHKRTDRVKRDKGKESRWARDLNHKISKQIVELASQYPNPVIVMERLKGIRSHPRGDKKYNRMISSWAFRQLTDFIQYKARRLGIPVIFVDPRKTSQICSRCGHEDPANRSNLAIFKCTRCGLELNADLNAARNIAARGSEAYGQGPPDTAPGNAGTNSSDVVQAHASLHGRTTTSQGSVSEPHGLCSWEDVSTGGDDLKVAVHPSKFNGKPIHYKEVITMDDKKVIANNNGKPTHHKEVTTMDDKKVTVNNNIKVAIFPTQFINSNSTHYIKFYNLEEEHKSYSLYPQKKTNPKVPDVSFSSLEDDMTSCSVWFNGRFASVEFEYQGKRVRVTNLKKYLINGAEIWTNIPPGNLPMLGGNPDDCGVFLYELDGFEVYSSPDGKGSNSVYITKQGDNAVNGNGCYTGRRMAMFKPVDEYKVVEVGRNTRIYVINGFKYPSVTSIIQASVPKDLTFWAFNLALKGFLDLMQRFKESVLVLKRNDILKLIETPDEVLKKSAKRGIDLHKKLELYFNNSEVEFDLNNPYEKSAYEWMNENTLEPLYIEQVLFSREHGYAGTCDFIGEDIIIDFKTNKNANIYVPQHPLQLAAYAIAYQEMGGPEINQGMIVAFGEDKYNYEVFDLTEYKQAWKWIVKTYGLLYSKVDNKRDSSQSYCQENCGREASDHQGRFW